MSNKGEKDAERERQSAARILGTARQTRSGRFCDNSMRKCCAAPVSCSSNKNKKPEESSGDAKKATVGGVTESEPRKSGKKIVTSRFRKARDLTASLGQKEAAGGQGIAQVSRTPKLGKPPSPNAKKTEEKMISTQQVWKEKTQPESIDRMKLSAKRQQSQPPDGTAKQSSKTTDLSPSTSKSKKSVIPKKVDRKEPSPSPSPSPKEQSSKGKQVQKKETRHKATTNRSYLEPESYQYHIKWNGFDEPDNQIGVCCSLCEEDLGVVPDGMGNYNGEDEFFTMPVVAILPCGHSFHYFCVYFGEPEGQQGDPPCVFCESFSS